MQVIIGKLDNKIPFVVKIDGGINSDGSWKASIVLGEDFKLLKQFLNDDVLYPEGNNPEFYCSEFSRVEDGGKDKVDITTQGSSLRIIVDKSSAKIFINRETEQENNVPDLVLSTNDFLEFVNFWGEIKAEIKWSQRLKQPWHSIPTDPSDPSYPTEPMYYNPQTGTTGLWKDIEKDWNTPSPE